MPAVGQTLRKLEADEEDDWLAGPDLAPEERRRRAQRALDLVAAGRGGSGAVAIVSAAKAILDETAPDMRDMLLKLLEGDEDRLEAWLRAELAECEKRREGR